MTSLPSAALLTVFVACAAVIWFAGVSLSRSTDVLADRWHLGSALGGAILLAIATNLPEIAITATAAVARQLDVAVGNILGGIALQTVVLVAVDAGGVRPRKPLTHMAASLTLVLEGALVMALLVVVVMATQLPPTLRWWRITPGAVLITVLWFIGLVLIRRAGRRLPWQPRGGEQQPERAETSSSAHSTVRESTVFGAAALATLIAGVLIERSGEEVFGRWGMSGVVFGATVLAAATALPELSTGLASARLGDYRLAVSDIFGSNAFLPVLFLPAGLISGQAVLPAAHKTDIYLTALAGLLTIVYMAGLIFRPRRQWLRLGIDSITVLVLYIIGIVGLTFISR